MKLKLGRGRLNMKNYECLQQEESRNSNFSLFSGFSVVLVAAETFIVNLSIKFYPSYNLTGSADEGFDKS